MFKGSEAGASWRLQGNKTILAESGGSKANLGNPNILGYRRKEKPRGNLVGTSHAKGKENFKKEE